MINQIMDLKVLNDLLAKTYGTSKVLVSSNNNILTIEPLSTDNPVSTSQEVGVDNSLKSNYVDKTGPGTLTTDDFKAMRISTKDFKFNREELYERK
jgi:hypothetical protein